MPSEETLEKLIAMSRAIGAPEQECAILGEGNSSARASAETFYVKASGASLCTAEASSFVEVRFDTVLRILEDRVSGDAEVTARLNEARVDPGATRRPSVETTFHAALLSLEGVNYVGHCHPVSANALLCSVAAPEIFRGRLFPDEIVCCGPEPVWVPYVDPGVPLALAVKEGVEDYLNRWGTPPRIVLMQNHGIIALGSAPSEVLSATFMMVKTAKILLGAIAAGGPNYLTDRNVSRIYSRPDEHYRQKALRGEA
jgi:rhamnose utilization protein RhaD (predicted bifunctional aldolase and dehydrogenase)